MGPEAFREFIRQLDTPSAGQRPQMSTRETPKTSSTGRRSNVDSRRTLLERRFEAAAMLADPFKLRLEADGVFSVKVLARVPARAWGLPPCLVEEIERMLGLLTARTCASDHLYAHYGQRRCQSSDTIEKQEGSKRAGFADEQRGGSGGGGKQSCSNKRKGASKHRHVFEFDPRFQRSPIDPFGRPPRLERIQPCLGPRQETEDVHGGRLLDDEGDFPPGLWDGPAGSEVSVISGVLDDEKGDTATKSAKPGPVMSPPLSLGGAALPNNSKGELPKHVPGELRQEPVFGRKPEEQTHQAVTNKSAGKKGRAKKTISAKMPVQKSASRFTCRARPHCSAVFARASNLRIHESSHAAAPEYHRLSRAPQLGRDPAPASFEGAGAPAEKFWLRTTLPPSVRRELQQLREESMRRRRQSLLAGPGLSGTVATWAGVVSPGRTMFGQSDGT